jgi:hypothetical protein
MQERVFMTGVVRKVWQLTHLRAVPLPNKMQRMGAAFAKLQPENLLLTFFAESDLR